MQRWLVADGHAQGPLLARGKKVEEEEDEVTKEKKRKKNKENLKNGEQMGKNVGKFQKNREKF